MEFNALTPGIATVPQEFKDIKGVSRIRKSHNRQYNEQKRTMDKQWSIKHYTEN